MSTIATYKAEIGAHTRDNVADLCQDFERLTQVRVRLPTGESAYLSTSAFCNTVSELSGCLCCSLSQAA